MEDTRSIVLYADHNNVWSPLRSLYWSPHSQACVARHPLSVIEEVISVYCPQCLTKYSDEECRVQRGRCASCFQCPRCESHLSLHHDLANATEGVPGVLFHCGLCGWSSAHSRPMGNPIASSELAKPLQEALTDMQLSFEQMLVKFNSPTVSLNDTNLQLPTLAASSALLNIPSLSAGQIASQEIAQSTPVLPSRVRLRSKKTVRCRKDFESNKMNILIQPKALPLEGDSSLRLQRGKWWLKDSSAIHEVPVLTVIGRSCLISRGARVDIERLVSSENDGCDSNYNGAVMLIQLLISNPKDAVSNIRLEFPGIIAGIDTANTAVHCISVIDGHRSPTIVETVGTLQPLLDPSLTLSLGAYEDELLREQQSDMEALRWLREQQVAAHEPSTPPPGSAVAMLSANNSVYLTFKAKIQMTKAESSGSSHQKYLSLDVDLVLLLGPAGGDIKVTTKILVELP